MFKFASVIVVALPTISAIQTDYNTAGGDLVYNTVAFQPDYYAALGLLPDASASQITQAYKQYALKMHPDKGGDKEKMSFLVEVLFPSCKQNRFAIAKSKTLVQSNHSFLFFYFCYCVLGEGSFE